MTHPGCKQFPPCLHLHDPTRMSAWCLPKMHRVFCALHPAFKMTMNNIGLELRGALDRSLFFHPLLQAKQKLLESRKEGLPLQPCKGSKSPWRRRHGRDVCLVNMRFGCNLVVSIDSHHLLADIEGDTRPQANILVIWSWSEGQMARLSFCGTFSKILWATRWELPVTLLQKNETKIRRRQARRRCSACSLPARDKQLTWTLPEQSFPLKQGCTRSFPWTSTALRTWRGLLKFLMMREGLACNQEICRNLTALCISPDWQLCWGILQGSLKPKKNDGELNGRDTQEDSSIIALRYWAEILCCAGLSWGTSMPRAGSEIEQGLWRQDFKGKYVPVGLSTRSSCTFNHAKFGLFSNCLKVPMRLWHNQGILQS